MIELYVPQPVVEDVKNAIQKHDGCLLEGYDPAIGQEHGRSTAKCEQFIEKIGFSIL